MNRNLKKIIAITLITSAFGAVISTTNFNLLSTKAYASSNELTNLKLKTSSGSTIKTYSDDDYKSKNEVHDDDITTNDIYYAKTSSRRIKINTSGTSSNNVRVFKNTSSSTKGVKTGSSIDLSSGKNTITVRVYSKDPGSVKYKDTSDMTSEYKIKVKYTGSSSNRDDEQGDVYLKNISLSDGDLSFSKRTFNYNVNVAESVSEIRITAKPDCDSDEYDDYEVTIDGRTVDEDDKFKKSISLEKGENKIKITVEDDNDEKTTYTLNIKRSKTTTTNTNNNSSNNESMVITAVKCNQWVQSNGLWQYNDSNGNPIKNNWFADRTYEKEYYLQSNGYMATGWLSYGGNWYYLGSDGAKRTGWQLVSGAWYYLDSQGKMQTGWIKDVTGKYYYLYSNGSMAYNTTIGGYKLGANGAWVK